MVICLERGADLHMAQLMPLPLTVSCFSKILIGFANADLHVAQLMPLPLTVSCFSKIQIGFTSLVPANPGSPGKRAIKRVCVCVCFWYRLTRVDLDTGPLSGSV